MWDHENFNSVYGTVLTLNWSLCGLYFISSSPSSSDGVLSCLPTPFFWCRFRHAAFFQTLPSSFLSFSTVLRLKCSVNSWVTKLKIEECVQYRNVVARFFGGLVVNRQDDVLLYSLFFQFTFTSKIFCFFFQCHKEGWAPHLLLNLGLCWRFDSNRRYPELLLFYVPVRKSGQEVVLDKLRRRKNYSEEILSLF